ncbi:hypothetical protein [Paraburkholderia guartelaensis]|nr:hypothetical protein [Paraburkholderia guartelaensis]
MGSFAWLPRFGASSYDDFVRRIAASGIRQMRMLTFIARRNQ